MLTRINFILGQVGNLRICSAGGPRDDKIEIPGCLLSPDDVEIQEFAIGANYPANSPIVRDLVLRIAILRAFYQIPSLREGHVMAL